MHNNIMAAGSRDRPPMLATGRYAQWRSRFLRYIDTRPNGDALRKCILEGPYTPTTVVVPAVPAIENSPAVPEQTTVETVLNMSPANKAHFESEKEAIHLILTGIGDEIYSTVDACKTAHEMWEAIERLQQAKNANPLTLVATAQPCQDSYYQTSKSHKSFAPTSKASILTRTHAPTRHKGKEIAKPITPPSESTSDEDSDPEQAQKDKEMYKNGNQTGQFGNQRIVNVDGARDTVGGQVVQQSGIQSEQGVPLQAEQSDWLVDTDEEIDEQELEAHYSYMAKIQEVPNADLGTDFEPLEHVQYNTGYNVFANEIQHSEQSEPISNTCVVETGDSNVITDSPNMCDNDTQNDQNDLECNDERVALANLIANLKVDVDENKKIQKQLKKDSCLVALQNKQTELDKYMAFNDRTVDYGKLEHQLNETLGLLAQKDIDIKEGLKLKAYKISIVQEKHDELVKHSLLKIVNQAWVKHSNGHLHLRAPTAHDMEILIKTCLMPLALKTQNDSFAFVHKLKQEMHANLKYVESLEKEVDELESDKAEFSNMYDMLLIPKPSVLGKPTPFLDSLKRKKISKNKSVPKTNESEGLSKPVTSQNLPQTATQAVRNTNVIKPGMYQIDTRTTQTRAPQRNTNVIKPGMYKIDTRTTQIRATQFPQTSRNTNPRVSTSTGVNHRTNVSRPQLKSTQMKDKVVPNTSQVKFKKTEVEDHHRISSISNQSKSVTACNDSLKSRTSNVNAVCGTCGKCVFNSNHDACVSKYLNDVNARTKKPKVVPISTRKPKSQANKSVATHRKKIVASESTVQNSKSYYRMLYEKTSKAWKWWIEQQCPSGYKWVPKTKMKWVPKVRNETVKKRVSFAIDNASRITNIVQLILFIVDSGCTKHMTGNISILCNFVEKYLGTVRFGNDQFAPILGYGNLVQGNIMINKVYYVEGLNHNLFSVSQFCDADLEVAFQKSTCFVRDLQGNDLLTGNRGSDLYTISLQETTSSTPICLMAKASPTQAWLWHRRLSHLNIDYINLLLKKDVVIGLPKLKYVKDQLCSSCEVSKAKRSSFKTKTVPSSKGRLNLLHMDLCGPMRVASINGKKYILVIVDDYSRYTWTLFLRSKDETPEVLKDFLTMIQRNLQALVISV
ncbi:integrase, catalytic region, zinc finger, CCHC-type containing protein [Tanacetum coccineum]